MKHRWTQLGRGKPWHAVAPDAQITRCGVVVVPSMKRVNKPPADERTCGQSGCLLVAVNELDGGRERS